MRKGLRFSFFVISFGFLISVFSVNEAKAQNAIGEIYRRMDLNNKSLQSLTADLTMVKTNTQQCFRHYLWARNISPKILKGEVH